MTLDSCFTHAPTLMWLKRVHLMRSISITSSPSFNEYDEIDTPYIAISSYSPETRGVCFLGFRIKSFGFYVYVLAACGSKVSKYLERACDVWPRV